MKAFIRFECECGTKEEIELTKEYEEDWYDVALDFSINRMKNFTFEQNPESFIVYCDCGREIEIG